MRPQQHRVRLTDDERGRLRQLIRRGEAQARVITRAHILLLANEGRPDAFIADAIHVASSTVARTRTRYCAAGLAAALVDRPRFGPKPKLDATAEATLIALACSEPPPGRGRWTMQLLADRLVTLDLVAAISDETVRRTLKKTRSSRG